VGLALDLPESHLIVIAGQESLPLVEILLGGLALQVFQKEDRLGVVTGPVDVQLVVSDVACPTDVGPDAQ